MLARPAAAAMTLEWDGVAEEAVGGTVVMDALEGEEGGKEGGREEEGREEGRHEAGDRCLPAGRGLVFRGEGEVEGGEGGEGWRLRVAEGRGRLRYAQGQEPGGRRASPDRPDREGEGEGRDFDSGPVLA